MARLITTATVFALSSLGLAACGDSLTNAQRGAIIGAISGAAVGNAADSNERRGAVIGAVAGATIGAAAGNYLDQQEAQLQEDLAGSGIEIDNQGDQLVLTGDSSAIEFGFDSATLTSRARTQVATIADTLVAYPETRIEVVGHTDSVGSDSYNMALSERRAVSVLDVLEANGVTSDRLTAFAAGENEPVASNATEAGRAQNRRVEITIIPTSAS